MRPQSQRAIVLLAVVSIAAGALALAQPAAPDPRLVRKKLFADQQRAALSQPLVGVRGSAGITSGLFPIRATGVSTAPARAAAEAFLAT